MPAAVAPKSSASPYRGPEPIRAARGDSVPWWAWLLVGLVVASLVKG